MSLIRFNHCAAALDCGPARRHAMPEISLLDQGTGDAKRQGEHELAPAADVSGASVGARLHRIRKSRQLTLQEASQLTGVSASAFSKIERNDLSPTISTMQRIATGLGVELVTLLTEQGAEPVTFAGRRSVNRAGAGSGHITATCNNTLLCADLKNKRVTPILTTVTARSPEDYKAWAKSEAEIFVMVLEGTLVVHSRLYEPLELNKGDCVYYDATTEHTWTSVGPKDAVVLWVLVDL
jgi:transcriptional regulator with XRE-family HTH domain